MISLFLYLLLCTQKRLCIREYKHVLCNDVMVILHELESYVIKGKEGEIPGRVRA